VVALMRRGPVNVVVLALNQSWSCSAACGGARARNREIAAMSDTIFDHDRLRVVYLLTHALRPRTNPTVRDEQWLRRAADTGVDTWRGVVALVPLGYNSDAVNNGAFGELVVCIELPYTSR
jgi:hypothetical protein